MHDFYKFTYILRLCYITVAGGVIMPIIYLRQSFLTSILEIFSISETDLGYLYSLLGGAFVLSYIPGGWLADKILPKYLIVFALISMGLLGIFYASIPSLYQLYWVFFCFGLIIGLTFSSSSLKFITIISSNENYDTAFSVFEGGKGLIEAILGTVAIFVFGRNNNITDVILVYSYICILCGVLYLFTNEVCNKPKYIEQQYESNLFQDITSILRNKEIIWVCIIIFSGYSMFWMTYSFSGFLKDGNLGLTLQEVATIIAMKLWTRPLGSLFAWLLCNNISNLKVIHYIFVALILFVFLAVFLPFVACPNYLIYTTIIIIGFLTYTLRSIYWSTIKFCNFNSRFRGLAIGITSFFSYSPDILIPLFNGYIQTCYPGLIGYQLYFLCLSGLCFLGIYATLKLNRSMLSELVDSEQATQV